MRRDGFTLLEAMVSLAILSLVGVAALGAAGRDLDVATRARAALQAVALAEDRLEAVRILKWEDLAAPPDSIAQGQFAEPFARYSWRAVVEPVVQGGDLYDVTIEVQGDRASRSLSARIYRPPDRETAAARVAGGRQ